MNRAVLSVEFAGPHVSVQDGGRPGMMRFGVPRSGPMDRQSFAAANLALGNPEDAAGIEVSLGGLTIECHDGAVGFAVAGGGFIVEHGGKQRGSWCTGALHPGETLTVRRGHWGSWCYLVFAGTLESAHWLDSAATHALSGFGGGRLSRGQELIVTDTAPHLPHDTSIPCPVTARPRHTVRVTMGPQERFFDAEAIDAFHTGPWLMTDAWDRMGVRLAGPSIAPAGRLDMPSEPVVRGAVQVAGDGVPTVLLADHQTTGGYPKIATVLDCDLDAFVQLQPRDPVVFVPVSARQAIGIARTAATQGRRADKTRVS